MQWPEIQQALIDRVESTDEEALFVAAAQAWVRPGKHGLFVVRRDTGKQRGLRASFGTKRKLLAALRTGEHPYEPLDWLPSELELSGTSSSSTAFGLWRTCAGKWSCSGTARAGSALVRFPRSSERFGA
jgi:hypothetical protein